MDDPETKPAQATVASIGGILGTIVIVCELRGHDPALLWSSPPS